MVGIPAEVREQVQRGRESGQPFRTDWFLLEETKGYKLWGRIGLAPGGLSVEVLLEGKKSGAALAGELVLQLLGKPYPSGVEALVAEFGWPEGKARQWLKASVEEAGLPEEVEHWAGRDLPPGAGWEVIDAALREAATEAEAEMEKAVREEHLPGIRRCLARAEGLV